MREIYSRDEIISRQVLTVILSATGVLGAAADLIRIKSDGKIFAP
jgi:hypothetical protein